MGTLFFLVSRNWLLGFGGNEFLLFLILIFVSLLPDIDEKHSKVNRWSGIIGRFVIHVFKHRGILHSIFFFGAVALVLSWLFGVLLIYNLEFYIFQELWMQIKIVSVLILTHYHFILGKYLQDFATDNNRKSSRFFRIINEVPTIILIVVVFVVVFKPLI